MRIGVFSALLVAYLLVPWVSWTPARGFALAAPRVNSGDEPHYLLIVSSLLRDRDLLLGDDYLRVRQGSADAGVGFRGNELDHHTILVDPATGAHALWQRVFDWRKHLDQGGFERLQPGFDNAVEVPAHPPAFPALVALLLAPMHPPSEKLEPWAISVVALLSFGALLAAWFAARRAGFTEREALATALLAGLASPLFAYARSFFSEPAIGLALSLALWALLARKPALCGALCFAAAAIKPPFGPVALGWAVLRLREGKREEALRLGATFAACCVALTAFNLRLAHTPLISGTAGFIPAVGPETFGMILFSNAHGLFAYAPWAAAGVFVSARAAVRGEPGLLRDLVWGAAPVLAVFAAADVEAGGFCYGPRYAVPFLPWLALATVAAWRDAGRGWRNVIAVLAAVSLAIAVTGALRYRELFDRPVLAAFER